MVEMAPFLEDLWCHWSSLQVVDLLTLSYILLVALIIATTNRLFVGKFDL